VSNRTKQNLTNVAKQKAKEVKYGAPNLKADLREYIEQNQLYFNSLYTKVEIAIKSYPYRYADEGSFKLLSTVTDAKHLAEILVQTILGAPSELTTAALVTRIATAISPDKYLMVATNLEYDNSERALEVKVLASELVSILHNIKLVETKYFPLREEDLDIALLEAEEEGGVPAKTGFSITSIKLRPNAVLTYAIDHAARLNISLVPFREIEKNSDSIYIDRRIAYNIFNKAFMRDDGIQAPLFMLNILHRMPIFIDEAMGNVTRPRNLKTKQDTKKWERELEEFYQLKQELGRKPFYLKHTLDSKYRVYCSGSIKYQGSDFFKSALDLGEYWVNEDNYEEAYNGCIVQLANCMDFDLTLLDIELPECYDSSKSLDKHTLTDRVKVAEAVIEANALYQAHQTLKSIAIEEQDHKAPVDQLEKVIREYKKLEYFNSELNNSTYNLAEIQQELFTLLKDVPLDKFEDSMYEQYNLLVDFSEYKVESSKTGYFISGTNTLGEICEETDSNIFLPFLGYIFAETNLLDYLLTFCKQTGVLSPEKQYLARSSYRRLVSLEIVFQYKNPEYTFTFGHTYSMENYRLPIKLRGMVALDATCSFAQIGAILSGNVVDAINSNLIGGDRCDPYGKTRDQIVNHPLFEAKTGIEINRRRAKDAIMQTTYGSMQAWKLFIGDTHSQTKMNKRVFYTALNEVLPGTMEVVKITREHLLNPNAITIKWTMPNGAECRAIHTTDTSNKRRSKEKLYQEVIMNAIDFMKQPTTASIVITQDRPIADKSNISLIALLIQSFDALLVREVIRICHEKHGFHIFTVHDSFACQYIHMEKMKLAYMEVLEALIEGDCFNFIIRQLIGYDLFEKDQSLNNIIKAQGFNPHCLC
jgi:hypothetical protein